MFDCSSSYKIARRVHEIPLDGGIVTKHFPFRNKETDPRGEEGMTRSMSGVGTLHPRNEKDASARTGTPDPENSDVTQAPR
ncbi:hypothetical protein TNCV_1166821 [Trichonephila clavipes]|uniref:Uncharacterized protein n=1 Tax=Trichonephila clavipes TaxID=2585209 RepID=A0A8X6VSW3_TRICX|nr:hypothetical protein TNCV_1166821 [Trichonephila clavipes]